MIRPSNSSGSHCMLFIKFLNFLSDHRGSWEISSYKFRLTTIDTIQILEEVILPVPFNFLLPLGLFTSPLRKYWIGEDVDFGRNFPFSFFGQKTFRSPCKVSVFRNFQTNNVWCSWTKKFWQFTYLAYYFTHFFRFFVRVLCWRSIVLKSVIWLLMNFFFDSNEFSPFSLPTEIYAWSVSK